MNDISLVTKAAVFHDKKAFNALVRKYQSSVRRFFLNHTLGDIQLSDDLAQDTFVKAYMHITSFRGMAGFSTWLMKIAYNVFYDYTRQHRLTTDLDATAAASQLTHRSDDGLKIDLYRALALLRDEERTCITLQLMDGLSIDRITQITDMPAGTVKSHLARGKQRLADYLKKNGYDR